MNKLQSSHQLSANGSAHIRDCFLPKRFVRHSILNSPMRPNATKARDMKTDSRRNTAFHERVRLVRKTQKSGFEEKSTKRISIHQVACTQWSFTFCWRCCSSHTCICRSAMLPSVISSSISLPHSAFSERILSLFTQLQSFYFKITLFVRTEYIILIIARTCHDVTWHRRTHQPRVRCPFRVADALSTTIRTQNPFDAVHFLFSVGHAIETIDKVIVQLNNNWFCVRVDFYDFQYSRTPTLEWIKST